jgi:hypothetical protein
LSKKKDDVAPEPEKSVPVPETGKTGTTRVKIWVDGVWSSLGEHRKGEVVELPDDDAKLLVEREMAQEC